MTACPSPAVVALRERLRTVECGRYQRREVLPFGVPAIDAALAHGGLALDSLHEVAGAGAGLADERAAALFVAGIAARAWGPVLWVVRRRDLFAPEPVAVGLGAHRLLHAEAADDAELVALMEEGLRHRGLGAVIGEVARAGLPATRRLQRAGEGGRTIALLLRRHGRAGDPLAVPSAAATRWRVGTAPAGARGARWRLVLAPAEGEPQGWTVDACDETGRCALPVRRTARATSEREPRCRAA